MKIMPISDSPWAPTGFGTNTKNISAIWSENGHHIGYAGCQNPKHDPDWETPWPLGQEEKKVKMELLPILHPGKEKFGEKSFDTWLNNFKPDLVFTHLDIQMFSYVVERMQPKNANIPLVNDKGKYFTPKERKVMMDKIFKELLQGPTWKLGSIIPIDGQPSIPMWKHIIEKVDYPVAMSRYGQAVLKEDFDGYESTCIPHGVDCNFFKPKMNVKPDDAFVVGTVARNQHRKNIPRLMKAYKTFVEENKLTPKDSRLLLHMFWEDGMGWNIDYMGKYYGIRDYIIPPTMGNLDQGQAPDEAGMVDVFNMIDVFALPTAGEGFGIPTVEAMACGKPIVITNYTTGYELVMMENPDNPDEEIPLFPYGEGTDNGRDSLDLEKDMSDRGFLIPYKDMWWDTPQRAAPQRAIVSERAMADAFTYYYKNPTVRLQHGANARKHAKKYYDWKPIGEKWLKYVKMIEEDK